MRANDTGFLEELAAGLLETAMGCKDCRTRNRLIKWANLCIDQLERARRVSREPVSLN